MANTYNNMTAQELAVLAETMVTVIGTGPLNTYGIAAGVMTTVSSDRTVVLTDLTGVAAAKAAYHSAVQAKDADAKTLRHAIAGVAATVYANPTVTDAMIAAIGLAPHGHGSPTPVSIPSDFIATPAVDGTVLFKWNRGTNPSGTTFVIEQQETGGAWTIVATATAARITLTGYAPGVSESFRVRATRGTTSSPASNVSTIYPTSGSTSLQLAA